jgi:hypothetical protein
MIDKTEGTLIHDSLSSVRGKLKSRVGTAKMPVYSIKHSFPPLSELSAICLHITRLSQHGSKKGWVCSRSYNVLDWPSVSNMLRSFQFQILREGHLPCQQLPSGCEDGEDYGTESQQLSAKGAKENVTRVTHGMNLWVS